MTRIEKRYAIFRPSMTYVRGRKRCKVCNCWIHKKIEDCQPCSGSKPSYSKFHKF